MLPPPQRECSPHSNLSQPLSPGLAHLRELPYLPNIWSTHRISPRRRPTFPLSQAFGLVFIGAICLLQREPPLKQLLQAQIRIHQQQLQPQRHSFPQSGHFPSAKLYPFQRRWLPTHQLSLRTTTRLDHKGRLPWWLGPMTMCPTKAQAR